MKILGIETSCDETSVALIKAEKFNFKILSNIVHSQIKVHKKYGGVYPLVAAREHEKNLIPVFEKAITLNDIKNIDFISVTIGPGLAPSLLLGLFFSKLLALYFKKPLIGVNHLQGHIFSPFLNEKEKKPKFSFPYICLIVSGGHTELVLIKDILNYKVLGKTLDDACGEAFDKVARILGEDYPGGPKIEKLAEKYRKQKIYKIKDLEFSPPLINSEDFNFSYSGLKTSVLYKVKKSKVLNEKLKSKIAFHFQESAFLPLVKKTLLASEKFNIKKIFITGGVSANNRLKEMFYENKKSKVEIYFPDKILTQDNAGMIALAGYLKYKKTKKFDSLTNLKISPNLEL